MGINWFAPHFWQGIEPPRDAGDFVEHILRHTLDGTISPPKQKVARILRAYLVIQRVPLDEQYVDEAAETAVEVLNSIREAWNIGDHAAAAIWAYKLGKITEILVLRGVELPLGEKLFRMHNAKSMRVKRSARKAELYATMKAEVHAITKRDGCSIGDAQRGVALKHGVSEKTVQRAMKTRPEKGHS